MFVTKIKNEKLYLCFIDTDCASPRYVTSYWEVKTPPHPELNNLPVHILGEGKYIKCFGRDIPVNPIREYPDFTEYEDIKKPRGRYTWKYGEWVKK